MSGTRQGVGVIASCSHPAPDRGRIAEAAPCLRRGARADGSSGSTVDDILAMAPIPIVFITAFPEKLLTGERPEPSFPVAKPFGEGTLRTTIGQALFCGLNPGAWVTMQ